MPDDLQVLIGYKQLCDLLSAASNVEQLTNAQNRLEAQVAALRGDIYRIMVMLKNHD